MPPFSNRPLGDLELAIMDVLWNASPGSVKDVGTALSERNLAYTTIMTTLDRLHKKALLDRVKQGQAYLYRPTMERQAYERRLVSGLLGDLPMASHEALMSGFLDYAASDATALDELERMIAKRKRELSS